MSCSNAYNLGYKESASYKNMSAAAQLLLNWVTEADDIGIFPSANDTVPGFAFWYMTMVWTPHFPLQSEVHYITNEEHSSNGW